jgi:hypothetical protein
MLENGRKGKISCKYIFRNWKDALHDSKAEAATTFKPPQVGLGSRSECDHPATFGNERQRADAQDFPTTFGFFNSISTPNTIALYRFSTT